jgi:hypothetical protein
VLNQVPNSELFISKRKAKSPVTLTRALSTGFKVVHQQMKSEEIYRIILSHFSIRQGAFLNTGTHECTSKRLKIRSTHGLTLIMRPSL